MFTKLAVALGLAALTSAAPYVPTAQLSSQRPNAIPRLET